MIDAVEPLSAILWVVLLIAAGLYPLGLMLPGCDCCGGGAGCPTPIEFNRCVRIVDTNPPPIETTFPAGSSPPIEARGWSLPIKRITDIGAHRVATKYAITGQVSILGANAMSEGESSTAIYKLHLLNPDRSHGKGIGEIRVTMQGVTRPMSWETYQGAATQYAFLGLYEGPVEWQYYARSNQDSTNAIISAEVVECNVISGGQWLDGTAATASALKAMMAVSTFPSYYIYIGFRAVFTANAALFNYIPATKQVELEYVIRHSRGSKHSYKRWRVAVYKYPTGTISPIPSGGLPPLALPQPGQYEDSAVEGCGVVYGEDEASTPEYPIKTVQICSMLAGQTIVMPTIEYVMSGDDFLKAGFSCAVTPGQYIDTTFFQNRDVGIGGRASNLWFWPNFTAYGEADWGFSVDEYVQASELKYIMRFVIPDTTGRQAKEWNFNHEEVQSFLNGEPLNIEIAYSEAVTLIREVTISAPHQYCGVPLCAKDWVLGLLLDPYGTSTSFTQSQLIPDTMTFVSALPPASWNISDEKGVVTLTNYCASSDQPHTVIMRRSSRGLGPSACQYTGSLTTCDGVDAAVYTPQFFSPFGEAQPTTLWPSARAEWFYCGDLLWAIENGPCRETVTIQGALIGGGYLPGTYTLGGDDNASYLGKKCAIGWPTRGVCPPVDMTVSVPGGDVCDLRCNKVGTFGGGDVVCGPFTVDCNNQLYAGSAPFPSIYGTGQLSVLAGRRRLRWCEPWQNTGAYNFFNSGADWGLGGNCVAASCENGITMCAAPVLSGIGDPSGDTTATASPQAKSVPAAGETFSVDFCCPQVTKSYTVYENDSRYTRFFMLPHNGASVYVTQEGKGESYCPFDIAWHQLAFIGEDPVYSWGPLSTTTTWNQVGRIYIRKSCPFYGAVWHKESPPCDWSISKVGDWFVAEKTESGLISVLATDDPPTRTATGTITITSGDSTATVEVRLWGT